MKHQRITWQDPDDRQVLVLTAFGISGRVISNMTGRSPGQVSYRQRKGEMRLSDFRMMRKNTVGGDTARSLLKNGAKARIESTIKRELPTKESRQFAEYA